MKSIFEDIALRPEECESAGVVSLTWFLSDWPFGHVTLWLYLGRQTVIQYLKQ